MGGGLPKRPTFILKIKLLHDRSAEVIGQLSVNWSTEFVH